MDILICPDKFKGSMTALQVCHAIKAGLLRHTPTANVRCHPMSDGGDGMVEVLLNNNALTPVRLNVKDPLFRPVTAEYAVSSAGDVAYVEMSRASGLVLLAPNEQNALETTTFGTGELILDAIRRGVQKLVLGIGGSATNDAGIGAAAALGCRFLDASGDELAPIGKNLRLIDKVEMHALLPELANVRMIVACDVQNPFYGKDGAARTFARQKGANDAALALLDEGLQNFARVIKKSSGIDLQQIPGSGAAGGLGGGAVALFGASLQSGIDLMIEATRLGEQVSCADLIITGEGKLDEQTLSGKVIDGVIRTAKKHDKPVAVLCGSSSLSPTQLQTFGIAYCDAIMKNGRSLQDAMTNGAQYLEDSAFALLSAIGDLGRPKS